MGGRIRRPKIIRRTVPVTDTALRRRLRESVALAKIRRQIGIALWSAAAGGRHVGRHFGGAVAAGRRRRRTVSGRGGRRRAVAGVGVSVVAAMVAVAQALHQVVTERAILSSVLLSVCLARVRVCGVVEGGEHVLVTEYRQRWIRPRRD